VSDRLFKKRLLTGSQLVIDVTFALIAAQRITLVVLAAAMLVLGCMYAVMGPARQA
jgi:hypothetical protein